MTEKISQSERLIRLFRANGSTLTHSQIAATDLYRSHSARMSNMREKGYQFIFIEGETTSENSWTMIEPVQFTSDESGQMRFCA